jgi:hypothetical protein
MWLYWMITPVGLWAAGLGLAAALRRLRRDPFAIMLPAWCVASGVEYFAFKQAADTHIFWPHQFGACVALGCGTLAAGLLSLRDRTIERAKPARRETVRTATAIVATVVITVPIALLARVALPMLRSGRETAGRYDEAGRRTESQRDRALFAEKVGKTLASDETLIVHSSFSAALNVAYAANHAIAQIEKTFDPPPKEVKEGAFLVDTRYTPASELRTLAARYPVTVVGPMWNVTRTRPFAPLVALDYEERLPQGLERLTLGTDWIRRIGDAEDPWATWEWRAHFFQTSPSVPQGEPRGFDQTRIAHNIAVARGETARAAELLERLVSQMTSRRSYDYTRDVHLLGVRVEEGPPVTATLLWLAGPSFSPFEGEYLVRSRVAKGPLLWPTVYDGQEKESAPPATPPLALWRPGFAYVQRFVVQRRFGKERFIGVFSPLVEGTTMPALGEGAPRPVLFELP